MMQGYYTANCDGLTTDFIPRAGKWVPARIHLASPAGAGEDAGLFAELLRVRPELRDVVRKLGEDHQMIAGILAAVRDLAREAAQATPGRREVIRRELGGLAAIAESHFGYEERVIGDVIDNGVRDTGWTAGVFEFRA